MCSYFICAISAKTCLLWNVEKFTLRSLVSFSNYSIHQGKLHLYYHYHLDLILPTADGKQYKKRNTILSFCAAGKPHNYTLLFIQRAHANKKGHHSSYDTLLLDTRQIAPTMFWLCVFYTCRLLCQTQKL